jgi:hypothetical protein
MFSFHTLLVKFSASLNRVLVEMKPIVNRSFINMNGFGTISKLRIVIIMRPIIINNNMKPIQQNEQLYDYNRYSEL